MQAINIFSQ